MDTPMTNEEVVAAQATATLLYHTYQRTMEGEQEGLKLPDFKDLPEADVVAWYAVGLNVLDLTKHAIRIIRTRATLQNFLGL